MRLFGKDPTYELPKKKEKPKTFSAKNKLRRKREGDRSKARKKAATEPVFDLVVGDRVTAGGSSGVVQYLPIPGGWWGVQFDGEDKVRHFQRKKITKLNTSAPAPAPKKKRKEHPLRAKVKEKKRRK